MTLRSYQSEIIVSLREVFRAGARSVCLVMCTGAGKTVVFCAIIRTACLERGKRALIICHRSELVDQAVAQLARLGVPAGALSASAASAARSAPVQVATVQTLIARGLRPPADIIIWDECHHSLAAEWSECLAAYPKALIIGATATPERADGAGLGALFSRLIVGARPSQLIAGGYLVAPRILRPDERLRPSQIAQRPADAYLAHARGRRAIVFCARVPQALKALQEFRIARLGAEMITGETPWRERRAAFAAIKAGKIDAIVNVNVATEGVDLPEVDCVILSRQFGTTGQFLQAAGRGLRPAPGKSDLLLLDLCGTTWTHGSPADDREFSLEGRGIRKPAEGVAQSYCRVCGAPIAPGEPCADCGTAAPAPRELKVMDRPLVPYAAKRAEAPEARLATLKRWIAIQREKGYRHGWLRAKWSAVYGEQIPDDLWRAAQ